MGANVEKAHTEGVFMHFNGNTTYQTARCRTFFFIILCLVCFA